MITAVFKLDDSIVLDTSPAIYSVDSLLFWSESDWLDILDKANVTFSDTDGMVTVVYTPTEDELALDGSYRNCILMFLTYSDLDGVIDWYGYDQVYIDLPEPVPVTDPEFTEISQEHEGPVYGPDGIGSYDDFHYNFSIELNDANTTKPITVRLQAGDRNGENWQDVAETTLTYSGDGGTWSDEIVYNMFTVDLANDIGRLWQTRIVCDYTLTDGTEGTIYSSDLGQLYAYKGDYVTPVSGVFSDGAITAEFKLDDSIVLDTSPAKYSVDDLLFWTGNEWKDIKDIASVTFSDTDGTITVIYKPSEDEIAADGSNVNSIRIDLRYIDLNGVIDWYGNTEVYIEFPEPEPITAPEFTDLGQEHPEPYYGDDGGQFDSFYYYFDIELNDADTTKPITVRLQADPYNNGRYEDLADSTITYSGDGGTWSGELVYDIVNVSLENDYGRIWQARIVCDYTLKDGTTGTIYSTDLGELYAYKGDYVYGTSGDFRDGTIYTEFQIKTDIGIDVSKVTPTRLVLWSGSRDWEILDKAEISGPDADGRISISYTPDDGDLDPDADNYMILVLNYEDKDGAINWNSATNVNFRVPVSDNLVAPEIQLDRREMENAEIPNFVNANIRLNDLKGGSATVTLYRQNDGGQFVPIDDEYASATYDPESEDDLWTVDLRNNNILQYDGIGNKERLKIVMEYTYPDGKTGTLEYGPFYQYAGHYAEFTATAAPIYDAENGTITADLIVYDSLADIGSITLEDLKLRSDSYTSVPYTTEISDVGNGTHLIRFTITTGQLESGRYSLLLNIICTDEYGYEWRDYPYAFVTVQ